MISWWRFNDTFAINDIQTKRTVITVLRECGIFLVNFIEILGYWYFFLHGCFIIGTCTFKIHATTWWLLSLSVEWTSENLHGEHKKMCQVVLWESNRECFPRVMEIRSFCFILLFVLLNYGQVIRSLHRSIRTVFHTQADNKIQFSCFTVSAVRCLAVRLFIEIGEIKRLRRLYKWCVVLECQTLDQVEWINFQKRRDNSLLYPFWKDSIIKGNNSLSRGTDTFLLVYITFQKGFSQNQSKQEVT